MKKRLNLKNPLRFAELSFRVDAIRQQIHQKEATIVSLCWYFGRLEDAEKQMHLAMAFDNDETNHSEISNTRS